MEQDDFQGSADQDPGMNDNNPSEVRFGNANGALGQHELLMVAGYSQFHQAENSYTCEER